MRKTVVAIAGLAAAGLAVAGCSPSESPDTTEGGGGEVEVFTWWASGSEKVGLDALVGVFNEQYPDIEFINASVAGGAGSNAKAALASRLEADDPPDTFQAHAGAELTDYIEAGQLQDLSSFYDERLPMSSPGSLIERLTVDGEIYSVPSNIHRANVVWVNTAVLEDAGIDPTAAPADMDAWIDDLQTLKDAGVESPLSLGTEWTQMQLFENVLHRRPRRRGVLRPLERRHRLGQRRGRDGGRPLRRAAGFVNTDFAGLEWDAATQILIDGTAGYNLMGDWAEAAFAQAG